MEAFHHQHGGQDNQRLNMKVTQPSISLEKHYHHACAPLARISVWVDFQVWSESNCAECGSEHSLA